VGAFLDSACERQPLLREEYIDVMTMRAFRQSVFARTAQVPDQQSFQERVAPLHFTVAVKVSVAATDGGGSSNVVGERQVCRYTPLPGSALDPEFGFEADDRLLPVLATMLLARAPERFPVGETLETLRQLVTPPPTEEEWRSFLALFEELVMAGVFPVRCGPLRLPGDQELTREASPMVGALNRLEVARGRDISSREHKALPLRDPLHRALLLLLDGRHTVAEVAEMLAGMLQQERTGGSSSVLPGGVRMSLRESAAFRQQPAVVATEEPEKWLEQLVQNEVRRLRSLAILEAI
jgi:hypothetical protein